MTRHAFQGRPGPHRNPARVWGAWLERVLLGLPVVTLFVVPVPRMTSTASPKPERLVAEAPIWGSNDGTDGDAFLPITIQGHAATLLLNLNCTKCDLDLSTVALAHVGVTLTDTTIPTLEALTIGKDIQHNVPITLTVDPTWHIPGPAQLPPVVGAVGVHFLTTHYDVLYDFPKRRVRLYAFPSSPISPQAAWLPAGITPADCGRMIAIPPGAATFTGMEVRLDGHPVTGVLEMMPYWDAHNGGHDEKMNPAALHAMQLMDQSSRVQALSNDQYPPGYPVTEQVVNVHVAVGRHIFWTGPIKIWPSGLQVEQVLPEGTPVVLLNLTTIKHAVLFNAVSSRRVCLATP